MPLHLNFACAGILTPRDIAKTNREVGLIFTDVDNGRNAKKI